MFSNEKRVLKPANSHLFNSLTKKQYIHSLNNKLVDNLVWACQFQIRHESYVIKFILTFIMSQYLTRQLTALVII